MSLSAQERGAQAREAQMDELREAFRAVFRSLSRVRGRDTHLGGSELSHAQFELLCELQDRGEMAAGELAAAAMLSPASVTQMLEHLAASGHVERVRSETDRRVVVSRLTPLAELKLQSKRESWRERWRQALAEVDSHDLAAATRVLAAVRALVESEPAAECSPTGAGAGQAPVQAAHR